MRRRRPAGGGARWSASSAERDAGVEAAGRRHDVDGHAAEVARVARPATACRSTAARHPASPTKHTAPGRSQATSRSTRASAGPVLVGGELRRPAAVARFTRSVMPTPWSASARSGERSVVTSPAASAAGQKRLPGPGEADPDVGGVDARVEAAHQQPHARARRCRAACGPGCARSEMASQPSGRGDTRHVVDDRTRRRRAGRASASGCQWANSRSGKSSSAAVRASPSPPNTVRSSTPPTSSARCSPARARGSRTARDVLQALARPHAGERTGPNGERLEVAGDAGHRAVPAPGLRDHGGRGVGGDDGRAEEGQVVARARPEVEAHAARRDRGREGVRPVGRVRPAPLARTPRRPARTRRPCGDPCRAACHAGALPVARWIRRPRAPRARRCGRRARSTNRTWTSASRAPARGGSAIRRVTPASA